MNLRLIGHRGFGQTKTSKIPENTLTSFKKLEKCNVEWTETDIQLTSDNVPVIFHDFSLDNKYIGSYTYNELDKIVEEKFGEPICTLEMLLCETNLKINAELKYPSAVEIEMYNLVGVRSGEEYLKPILEVLERYDREIIFSCFTPEILEILSLKIYENLECVNSKNREVCENLPILENEDFPILENENLPILENKKFGNFQNKKSSCVLKGGSKIFKDEFESKNRIATKNKYEMMFLFCKNEKGDLRTICLKNALNFCLKFKFSGIVLDAEIATPENVEMLVNNNLNVYLYGENIESIEDFKRYIDYGVTGVIVDDVVKAISNIKIISAGLS